MEDLDKVKDEELLLDNLSSAVADYAYEAKDNDFSILVEITCDDGWSSCKLVKPIELL